MKQETKQFNGRDYKDIVLHTTISRFGIWDRIKIMFGRKVYIQSDIYCNTESVNVVGSEAKTMVQRLMKWPVKHRGRLELMTNKPTDNAAAI